ncbi:hypothetical protein A4G19_05785 [Pasteurellaceae bacterium Macca]|nr:hypothetical protein [Pasteurellaceae bacterium Macca]
MTRFFGLALTAGITALAFLISQWSGAISALTLAIVLGIILGNSVYARVEARATEGVNFAKTWLLRTGIVLYGFRITVQDVSSVGGEAIISDAILLISTFFLTCWLGIHYLKIDRKIVQLTAAGCSICGAAAIMATAPVVKAKSEQVSVAVALIVLFGTLCMFLYPLMYPYLNSYLTDHQFGIYIGSSVHEVAQVYAAGGNISPAVADAAVITKMIRVMMLAPFLLALSYTLQREDNSSQKIMIPWFAVWFIVVALLNSFIGEIVPKAVIHALIQLDTILLMMAMSALGLTTKISAFKQAGVKPLLLGGIICLWLIVGGFTVNWLVSQSFALVFAK